MKRTLLSLLAIASCITLDAASFQGIQVVDREYVCLRFRDGEVRYRDNGEGPSAFLGHTFINGDDTLNTFLPRFSPTDKGWVIESMDDMDFPVGTRPLAVHRRAKPMNIDHTFASELDHWVYLRLPKPMKQGCTYTVTIPEESGSDTRQASVTFDIWNCPSEAVHVNILGYAPSETVNAADLYIWLGDGGPRDYSAFEGDKVWLYEPATGKSREVSEVSIWKPQDASAYEAGGKDLTGSSVWNIDFAAADPGTYRLVVEGVGCSMDFRIGEDIYREPFRYSILGYYYMRIGEPLEGGLTPRQPQFIPGKDPKGFKVYLSELHPWHPEWRKLRGDVWDEPHFKNGNASAFWRLRPEGNPVNDKVIGGHSDAMDWDRHLAHVSNIYDLLLPYLLTGGRLGEDDLGIRESGNGIPDLLDEARNEVDFFLSIRDGEAYSQGVTNPDREWKMMFQAGCTTMAAWANAANCAVMAEAFRINGNKHLMDYYTAESVKAFRFAERQEDLQLDDRQGIGMESMRGRDFRQMAAAFLYNLTGERAWEDIAAQESVVKDGNTPILLRGRRGAYCQIWGTAAYLTCPHVRHYHSLYSNMLSSLEKEVEKDHISPSMQRPSRRAADDARWITSENLQLVMLAHYASTDEAWRKRLERAMYLEAGWGLGRNPGNIVEMTGLGQRHITDCYSSGRNDGLPGTHPGQTPFNGTETWSEGDGGDARIILRRCYPDWWNGGWPRQESYFNQRYFWVNGEFTPRETMRGKAALLAYLYGIRLEGR